MEVTMDERRIRITAGGVEVTAVLDASRTAGLVWEALPVTALCNTWGDEIYFRTEIEAPLEEGREVVDLGDVGYWPPGQALCLFFGRTPASRGDEIRPASAVSVIGRIEGDPTVLKAAPSGARIVVARAS